MLHLHRSFLLAAVVFAAAACVVSAQNNATEPLRPLLNTTTTTDPITSPDNATALDDDDDAIAPIARRIGANTTADALNNTLTNATAPVNGTLAGATVPTPAPGQCARQCVRQEFRALSPAERKAYFDAVIALQSRRGADGVSEYDRLVRLHMQAQQFAHGTDQFLPWHRGYLAVYERALQAIDPSVCVPYWNWAVDSQAPENSPIMASDAFGTNGRGNDNCVQDGAFAAYRPAQPEGTQCLQRSYNGGDVIGALHPVEAVNRAIATVRDYSRFRSHVEGTLHPGVHNNIGGHMSQMHSPNDPVFWSHHAYVDYMWAQWQRRNGFGFGNNDGTAALPGLPGYRAADVLDHRDLCYSYADLDESALGDDQVLPPTPPPATRPPPPSKEQLPELVQIQPLPQNESDDARYNPKDRKHLAHLRLPEPTPDAWCRMNNFDVAAVRTLEDEYRTVYKKLNSIKGYVSPCAMWKRPTLVRALVGKVDNFIVDVEGVGRIQVGYKPETAQADAYEAVRNVRQRVEACTADVERPVEEYRAEVQSLVGASAFNGAGTLKRVTGMDSVAQPSGAAATVVGATAASVFATAIAVIVALV